MYGVEAQDANGGLGGLAAQAPPDVYFPQAIAILNETPLIGSPPRGGVSLPFTPSADQPPAAQLMSGGNVNGSGTAVGNPVSHQQSHWSSVLDFHNSVAPWILIGILVLYGWLVASARVSAGRASASAVL